MEIKAVIVPFIFEVIIILSFPCPFPSSEPSHLLLLALFRNCGLFPHSLWCEYTLLSLYNVTGIHVSRADHLGLDNRLCARRWARLSPILSVQLPSVPCVGLRTMDFPVHAGMSMGVVLVLVTFGR